MLKHILATLCICLFSTEVHAQFGKMNRRKGFDIHARAAWKTDPECDFGCVNGKNEEECGTEEECAEYFRKE